MKVVSGRPKGRDAMEKVRAVTEDVSIYLANHEITRYYINDMKILLVLPRFKLKLVRRVPFVCGVTCNLNFPSKIHV